MRGVLFLRSFTKEFVERQDFAPNCADPLVKRRSIMHSFFAGYHALACVLFYFEVRRVGQTGFHTNGGALF